jgi:hypothetical protein
MIHSGADPGHPASLGVGMAAQSGVGSSVVCSFLCFHENVGLDSVIC